MKGRHMRRVAAPLPTEVLENLRVGEELLLSGVIYAARDAAHKRISEAVMKGESSPVDFGGQVLYYVGPTPPRPGAVIGSAGPTTASRMDPWMPLMLRLGVKATIGKGSRAMEVREAMRMHRAVYLGTIGGAGAYLSRTIKKADVVAYQDLGTEAIWRLEVEDFPVIVVNDIQGNDLLEQGKREWGNQPPQEC